VSLGVAVSGQSRLPDGLESLLITSFRPAFGLLSTARIMLLRRVVSALARGESGQREFSRLLRANLSVNAALYVDDDGKCGDRITSYPCK
jgi:hypothetical protein